MSTIFTGTVPTYTNTVQLYYTAIVSGLSVICFSAVLHETSQMLVRCCEI